MTEEVNECLEMTTMAMKEAIEHLEKELTTVRAGQASPSMLNNVYVDYYGSQTALNQVANVTREDGRTLSIKPWEKSMLGPIEQAVFAANLGVTPQNNGELIRISIPQLTEERRKELAKKVKAFGEDSKVSIRRARKEANDMIKDFVKDGLPEDQGKDAESKVQENTNKYGVKVDGLVNAKSKEILTL